MTAYCAVVKYSLDASPKERERILREGLGMIAMELVAEHDYDAEMVEGALEDAQGEAELELYMKAKRE